MVGKQATRIQGLVAQLVERCVEGAGVAGSIPARSTKHTKKHNMPIEQVLTHPHVDGASDDGVPLAAAAPPGHRRITR